MLLISSEVLIAYRSFIGVVIIIFSVFRITLKSARCAETKFGTIEFEIKVGINTKSDKTFIDAKSLGRKKSVFILTASRFERDP